MIIESMLQDRRKILTEMGSKAVLSAFHIPVAYTMVAHSPDEALLIAQQIGFPAVMKANSPDITHKIDAGGVRLNLGNAEMKERLDFSIKACSENSNVKITRRIL